MRGTSIGFVVASAMIIATGCGAGDTRIDPGDLELRDLLGVAPDVASRWDAEQRASARRVLRDAMPAPIESKPASTVELWISDQWDEHKLGHLPGRGLDVLSALALDAGHMSGPLVIAPAPRLGMIASYETVDARAPRLIVNPVVLAAMEPEAGEVNEAPLPGVVPDGQTEAAARIKQAPQTTMSAPADEVAAAGNPYSFYGSVAECAFAQRTRCESCLASNNCAAVTSANDGNVECTTLGENNGRGYFLLCINLALSITSVDRCTGEAAPGCSRDTTSANDLGRLENNAGFLDDATCGGALDSCLAEIYGDPGEFPSLSDGGVTPPARPPRNTSIDCGDSCSNNNSNCEASPNCNCEGPSCNNSFSCDSACSSSNDQSGCGDSCASCSEDDGTTDSGGSCGGDDGSGTSSGGGCGGDDGSSSSGGSCGGDSGGSSGGSCGGGDSGGSCGGDSCGGSSGGGSCGGDSCGSSGGSCGGDGCSGGSCSGSGGSSGSSCNVAKRSSSAGAALAVSLMWAFMPVPVAALIRRRGRRKKGSGAADPVTTTEEEAS